MSVRDWKGTAKMTVKKLGEIIGTTTDTGGTATAGTLMAKVNALLTGQGTQAKDSDVQEILSQMGQGVTASLKVPIKMDCALIGSGTVKGTGNGLVFVEFPSVSIKLKIIVDGVTLINTSGSSMARDAMTIFFPFNKSFEVTSSSNTLGVCAMYY